MGPRDPEEAAGAGAPVPAAVLPAATRMGAVHLSVADVGRSVDYYAEALGLRARERSARGAVLTAGGEDLLVLHGEPGARSARGYAGLYHFALLVPERADLARWLVHVARERVPLVGLSDHFVSEAIYLSDPDDHGIEVYWDRPRERWEGVVDRRMTTLPLDTGDLLGVLGPDPAGVAFDGLAAGTTMGHVHFRVADVAETIRFHRDVLGFALMAALGPQAAFLSAGGYHHHVGANTWESAGAPFAPAGHATLRRATVVLPDAQARDEAVDRVEAAGQEPVALDDGGVLVHDPSGNPLVLATS
jgi:catechol 2,3-dioxygenase